MKRQIHIAVMMAVGSLVAAQPAGANPNDIHDQQFLWKFQQRAEPLGYIPDQAKAKALQQLQKTWRAAPGTVQPGGSMPQWVNVGPAPITAGQTAPPAPVSGRVTCIAVDPQNSSHWLAGTAQGGVWETTDAGTVWVPKTDDQPSLAMGAVAFAPSNPLIQFAGTGEPNGSDGYPGAGLLKSTDGGRTWQLLGESVFAKTSFSAIRVHPTDPNTVVAATAPDRSVHHWRRGSQPLPPVPTNGVYVSTDGGAHWARKLTGPVVALETHPSNFNNQYAAMAEGDGGSEGFLYRSADGGNNWTRLTGPWTGQEAVRVTLSISVSSPNTLYAAFAGSSSVILGIWRTDNAWSATPTWVKLPDPRSNQRQEVAQLSYNFAISVDPANASVLYFAEIGVWKYNGTTWTTLAGYYDNQTRGIQLHPDQHVLVWAGNRLIVGNDGGVWSTIDGGATFLNHNSTLSTIQFYYGSLHPSNPNIALGGEQDNGSSMWFGTNGWKMVGPGDGGANAISQQNPDNNWILSTPMMGVVKVTGGGQYLEWLTGQQQGAVFIAPIVMCPGNENLVLAGATTLWRCDNIFSSTSPDWTANTPRITMQSQAVPITAIAFAPSDPTGNTYAFGTLKGQVLTTARGGSPGGANWNNWAEPDEMIPLRYVTALAFDPVDPNILYVTVSGFDEATPNQPGHCFRTRTALAASATWDNISPPVDLPNNCLAIDPKKPNTIYVGTDLGIWRTQDGGANWEHMGPETGMPNVSVFDLQIHRQTGRVFAFTHGRGAFVLDPEAVNIPPAITGFSPTTGPAGTTVSIRGSKLDGTTAVQFNGVNAAAFTVNSATNLSATVPAGATTGPISLSTPAGNATSAGNFVVVNTPAILDFSPQSGNVGTVVTLTGVNFTGATAVAFAGVNAAAFTVNSATRVTVTVPAGAANGRITLTTPGGTATSPSVFTVTTVPVISGFSPAAGGIGTSVVITGANFNGATSVKFNGVSAAFTVNQPGQITATVPAGASSGLLQVATPAGTVVSGNSFTVFAAPAITGLSPNSGASGTKVTLAGANFTGASAVKFNGLNAAGYTIDSISQVTATAPAGVTTGPVRVETPGGVATSSLSFTVLPPPANDNFNAAQVISGNSGTLTGNNIAATKETSEPAHAGNEGGKSVWYKWTAPATGLWTFETRNSTFDTLLGVYSGTTLPGLTTVASNDNVGQNVWSSVTFQASAGATYYVAVDGFKELESEFQLATFADAGTVSLSWRAAPALPPEISGFSPVYGAVGSTVIISGTNFLGATNVAFNGVNGSFQVNSATQITATVPAGATTGPIGVSTPGGVATSLGSFTVTVPPVNDPFARAQVLTGLSGTALGNNAGATLEPSEPNHAGFAGGKSIWFAWTAPTNGTWKFDTRGSSFDTLLGIYTGAGLTTLSTIANNDNAGGFLTSEVTLNGASGITYWIAVDGKAGAEGQVVLHWLYVSTAPAITGFNPPSGGPGTQVTITGSNLVSVIGVAFNGVSAPAFVVDSSTQVRATVPPGAGTGPITILTLNGAAQSSASFIVGDAVIPNDSFGGRISLAGGTASARGLDLNCSKEAGEPDHAGNLGGRSVWWSWTAPTAGTYKLTTAGSDFDTLLAVYAGTTVAGLTEVASNDDDALIYPQSSVTFDATAGTTYQIAVDGYDGAAGQILLNLFPITSPQALFYTGFEAAEGYSTALTLSGQNGWDQAGAGDNGIVYNYFADFGQQAYIGNYSSTPGSTLYVWHALNYTPTTTFPVVNFASSIEIVNSTWWNYDDFDWDVYNQSGQRLFLLNFDNSDMKIYYILNDSGTYHDTGFTFENDKIYTLVIMMDFNRNRWSAYLDANTIVTEQPISADTARALNLGDIDARWRQKDGTYGDNAMVFDDFLVWKDVSPTPRFVVQPQSQSVVIGSPVVLFALADSTIDLSYQWEFNAQPIPGATNQVLDLGSVNPGAAGSYRLVATNLAGRVTSQGAVLTVTPLPNLAPYQPANWSDEIVVTTTPGSTIDTPVLRVTDEIYVNWAVRNAASGGNISGKFFTGLYVDNVLRNAWPTDGLNAGAYAFATNYDIGKLSAGPHSLTLRADLTSVVREQDENDNDYTRVFTVTGTQTANPLITAAGIVQGTSLGFTINGVGGKQYHVLTSTNLVNWSTNSTVTINANGDPYPFLTPLIRTERTRFFRLQAAGP